MESAFGSTSAIVAFTVVFVALGLVVVAVLNALKDNLGALFTGGFIQSYAAEDFELTKEVANRRMDFVVPVTPKKLFNRLVFTLDAKLSPVIGDIYVSNLVVAEQTTMTLAIGLTGKTKVTMVAGWDGEKTRGSIQVEEMPPAYTGAGYGALQVARIFRHLESIIPSYQGSFYG